MPIRPIDMQTMIPKAQEHKQVKDSTVNRPDTEQQQANMKGRDLADQKMRQVNRMDRRDQMKVRDDGRRQQNSQENEDQEDESNGTDTKQAEPVEEIPPEKTPYDNKKKLKSLQYHKFDMKV